MYKLKYILSAIFIVVFVIILLYLLFRHQTKFPKQLNPTITTEELIEDIILY